MPVFWVVELVGRVEMLETVMALVYELVLVMLVLVALCN